MAKIAITGTVAVGKTTVCKIFKQLGAFVLDSDSIIHSILNSEGQSVKKILSFFGPNILKNGSIDRRKLANRVFSNPKELKQLTNILYPVLFKSIESIYEEHKKNATHKNFIVEMPLVQESNYATEFDAIIAVTSDPKIALQRFLKKGFTKESFFKRNNAQWEADKKAQYADYIINNNETQKELQIQVLKTNNQINTGDT